MLKINNPICRKLNLVLQELESETLIYDLGSDRAFCLNETSALVWQYSDGNNSISEIAGLMSKRLNTSVPEEVVWLALDQLKKDKLLENGADIEINFNGSSRREVIKKIGFASMIALPIVSSVVAPSAAYAASVTNCPPTGTCIPAGAVICPAGCTLRVNCELHQAATTCAGPPYAPQPNANVNCGTSPGFVFAPADCKVDRAPA